MNTYYREQTTDKVFRILELDINMYLLTLICVLQVVKKIFNFSTWNVGSLHNLTFFVPLTESFLF